MDKVAFLGALADQDTAAKWLSVDSDGAAKIVLEVPSSEFAQVMRLATKTKSLLRSMIEDETRAGA